jgi:hypothetical protein
MLKVQVRDDAGRLLTEWFVKDDEDGSEVRLVEEIAWLRKASPTPDKTNAEALTS